MKLYAGLTYKIGVLYAGLTYKVIRRTHIQNLKNHTPDSHPIVEIC